MSNRVGANTHPCFTQLQMQKASEETPSNSTNLFMSVLYDWTTFRSFDGSPILARIRNIPSRLTRSKAFVRSVKAVSSDCICSMHFSYSWCQLITGWIHRAAANINRRSVCLFSGRCFELPSELAVLLGWAPVFVFQRFCTFLSKYGG